MAEVVDLCASSDDEAPPGPPVRRQHTQPASIEISSDDEAAPAPAPRPADDDEDDEDFLAFFSSRRGPAPAPAAPPAKVSAKDTQVGLSSGLVNTAAGATSGDDVAGALKAARRSK